MSQAPLRPEGDALARYGANMVPLDYQPKPADPTRVFVYPFERTKASLVGISHGTPDAHHGFKLRYVNPATGASPMPTIGSFAQRLPAQLGGYLEVAAGAEMDGGTKAFLQQRLEGPQLTESRRPGATGPLVLGAPDQGESPTDGLAGEGQLHPGPGRQPLGEAPLRCALGLGHGGDQGLPGGHRRQGTESQGRLPPEPAGRDFIARGRYAEIGQAPGRTGPGHPADDPLTPVLAEGTFRHLWCVQPTPEGAARQLLGRF